MDIGKAFSFVGDDPRWVNKILIGGGLVFAGYLASITVIGGIVIFAILLGYYLQLVRNVIDNQPRPLPEWENWGELLSDGLKSFVVILALSLPILLVLLVTYLPGVVLSATSETGTSGVGSGLILLGACLLLPLSLLLALVQPIAIGRYAMTRNIGQALNLGAIFATLRANFVTYLTVMLLSIATGFVGGLGLLACGLGLPFTLFYAQLVNYHLYGQAHRQTQGALPGYGQPQPPYPRASPF